VKAYGQLFTQTSHHVTFICGVAYKKNPHTLHELEGNIWEEIYTEFP
jgi:hypothetical protein